MNYNKLKYKSIGLFLVIVLAITTLYHMIISQLITINISSFQNSLMLVLLVIFSAFLTVKFVDNHISDLDKKLIDRLRSSEESAKRILKENIELKENIGLKNILNEELKNEISYCETILNNLPEIVLVTDEKDRIIYSNEYGKYFCNRVESSAFLEKRKFDVQLHKEKNQELLSSSKDSIVFENQDFYFQKQLFDLNKRKYVLTIGEDRKDLNAVNKKLLTTIDQLKSTDAEVNFINNKFNQLLDFISNIEDFKKIEINSFLIKVFNFMFTLIDQADCGSVYVFNDGLVEFLSAKGHDIDLLKNITIYQEDFIFTHKEGIVVTKKIIDKSKEYYKKRIVEASLPIKETLSFPIQLNNAAFGSIALDISENRTGHFSKEDIQMAKPIEKLINIIINIVHQKEQNIKFTDDILDSFMELMSIHSQKLFRHSKNVGEYASDFAEFLKFDEEKVNEVYWSGLMHDLGFLGIPKEELDNPIEAEDFYQNHVTDAYKVMSKIKGLEKVAMNILCHHENYDGSGYPKGLKGDEIPIGSQIISLINYYDFSVNVRNQSFKSFFEALEEQRNISFDTNLIDELIKWVHKNENI
jgi:HD-GYP domain-containing protein (c-di-GMP phosphodiesterase class II)